MPGEIPSVSDPRPRADKAAPADKLPPHATEAEQGVIGCALLSPDDCLPPILAALKSKSAFYDLRHQTIFSALAAMHDEWKAIDLITVQQRLKDAGRLDQIGGIAYLSELQDKVPSAANLSYWLDIVREKFELRKIVQTCADVTSRIYSYTGNIDDLKFSVQSDLAEVFGGATGDLPDMVDAAGFIAAPIDPPAELVAGILHKGSKLAFGGSSKSFKTWSLLDLAISVATGADWLGRTTARGNVLFGNFEIQPHAWQQRLIAVARAKGVELPDGALTLWNLRGHAADYRQLVPRIIQRCRRENFALIVLDPIYKLYGGTDENAAGDVAALLNALETLATATGAAIAFGAHFAKGNASAKEAIDRISGSGVFARDPDSLLIFTKHEADDAFTVEPILRNFASVAPFAVRWQFPLMHRADDLDPAKLKQAGGRKPVYLPADLLAVLPPEGLANADWLAKADGEGMSKPTFYRLRKELQKGGKIHASAVTGTWQPILTK